MRGFPGTTPTCSIDGCESPTRARGWCNRHYCLWRAHGDPLAGAYEVGLSIEERFRRQILVDDATGCWLWLGDHDRRGYGRFWISGQRDDRVRPMAHRWSFEHHVGPIPDGLCVCHRCDNPPCCNPEHLFVGTHKENVADCAAKGRRATPTRKLTPEQVFAIRASHSSGRGPTHRELAKAHGVAKSTITSVLRGDTWKAA